MIIDPSKQCIHGGTVKGDVAGGGEKIHLDSFETREEEVVVR